MLFIQSWIKHSSRFASGIAGLRSFSDRLRFLNSAIAISQIDRSKARYKQQATNKERP